MGLEGISLKKATLPDCQPDEPTPAIPLTEFVSRLAGVRTAMGNNDLEMLIVYGDREHAGNIQYLTGLDPRFEEAIVLVPRDGEPVALLGNEDYGYLDAFPAAQLCKRELFQSLSLMGQPRDRSRGLKEILAGCGLASGKRTGIAGWKYFDSWEMDDAEHCFETPSYLVDLVRRIAGFEHVVNAGPLFLHPETGLRSRNSADQLAVFEYAATMMTNSMQRMLRELKPGRTEFEVFSMGGFNGFPFSVHPMFSTGARAMTSGLLSPSSQIVRQGDPFACATGVWGSLSARLGYVDNAANFDKNPTYRKYFSEMVVPYFDLVSLWYRRVRIAEECGFITGEILGRARDYGIELVLNPGHLIHCEEWTHSPFYPGSSHTLRSGMLLQCDMIPSRPGCWGTNGEDTIALADAPLRAEIARRFPAMCRRIQLRRKFMTEMLGIELSEDILPFSNLCGAIAPFILSPEMVVGRS